MVKKEAHYKIKIARKASRSDLVTAMKLYTETVDEGSDINTNEIVSYIHNKYDIKNKENRKMFFYVLYFNNKVVGFAECAYLPKNKILFIDYLCIKPRNHVLFYSFYNLIYETIANELNKNAEYIYYILTELSVRQNNGKFIDLDSNYFRQLLSIENFKILQVPYYQPSLGDNLSNELIEFNLAIKSLRPNHVISYNLDKTTILSFIEEILFVHYGKWYYHFNDKKLVDEHLNYIFNRIRKELSDKKEFDENIITVNCQIFDEGKCPKINPENLTISTSYKRHNRKLLYYIVCLICSSIIAIICYYPSEEYQIVVKTCSFITIFTTMIGIFNYFKNR